MPWIRNRQPLLCFVAVAFAAVGIGLWQADVCLAQADVAQETDDFAARLVALEELLEEQRIKNKIPGMAIAVVKDGKVVMAKGFGLRDLEAKKAVEPETLFAIGSSTKAFTSTLVAMLVDEGKMDWDDPVTKYLPEFTMDVDTGDQEITLRDLLCHRTGFTRMGLIWASGSKTRDEVIKQAATAKPYSEFQKDFYYNNVMYMTSGVCAGRAMESDWDALIAEKIFGPLEMNDSSTSISVAQKDPRLSLGYTWNEDKEKFTLLPMRNLDSIGPSGSINSNVIDMANWVRFQLANGEFAGKQLMSKESQAETWKEQIEIGGGIGYGFGWMLREWNGKEVVEHGGNIDGFGAQVTLLPEMDAGYVLLTNVTATPLQGGSISLVFDTLFGEPKTESEEPAAEIDMEELEGNYIANFGPFDNATMEVKVIDEKLTIDVPGQMAYELKAPDEDGKWFFALTDTIAVSFNRNDEGRVISVTMYQGGATPEFLREDYEPKPVLPLGEVTPLLGEYRDEEADASISVSLRKGQLVIDTGAGGVFTFKPPAEGDDKWDMKPVAGVVQVRFNRDDDGKVTSLTRFQREQETEMVRISGDSESTVPSVDELLSKVEEQLDGLKNSEIAGLKLKGQGSFVHQGVKGTYESTAAIDGRFRTFQDFGKMAKILEVYDGEQAVTDTTIGQREELLGKRFALMKMQSFLWLVQDWKHYYTEVEVTGEQEINGEKTFVVSLSGDEIYDRKLYIAAETGLILREESVIPSDLVGAIPVEINYSDFRKVGGATMPFRFSSDNPMSGTYEVQLEEVEVLKELSSDAFVVDEFEK